MRVDWFKQIVWSILCCPTYWQPCSEPLKRHSKHTFWSAVILRLVPHTCSNSWRAGQLADELDQVCGQKGNLDGWTPDSIFNLVTAFKANVIPNPVPVAFFFLLKKSALDRHEIWILRVRVRFLSIILI